MNHRMLPSSLIFFNLIESFCFKETVAMHDQSFMQS